MRAVIEGWHPANRGNQKLHWARRRKLDMQAKEMAYWHAKYNGWERLETPARLHVVLVCAHGPLPDTDNAYARVKPLVDGLKPFIVDDSPKWLTLTVECRRGPAKQVEMELEAAAPKWWERSDSLFLGDYEFIPAEVIRIGRAKEAEGDASPAAE